VYWSFSEYLNLIELRSQTWCIVNMASDNGIRIPHSEAVLFYAVIEGSARLTRSVNETTTLQAGDIAIVASGEGHALRTSQSSVMSVPKFLNDGDYVDTPIHISVGRGAPVARVLCGRLKPRWPGARRPRGMPSLLGMTSDEMFLDLPRVVETATAAGGCAMLTKLAMLIFVEAFRSHPESAAIFRDSRLCEPIAQALQFIETHPFTEWTVARLASKVGMGRSSFATRFAIDVGKTPMTFVTEERMKHAAGLLERTDLKVAEIADQIGYRSESAFSHRFFVHFGMTPGEMRSRKQSVLQSA
jgi:AraC-like DNA-binding protein